MRVVLGRVEHASVEVAGETVGRIGPGMLAYVGVRRGDGGGEVRWMAGKLLALRFFADDTGRMNRSVRDTAGSILLIPNFTLAGRTRKGARPSFTDAADPETAQPLFEELVERCGREVRVAKGVFGASMRIDARFDGPVTLVVDTPPGAGTRS